MAKTSGSVTFSPQLTDKLLEVLGSPQSLSQLSKRTDLYARGGISAMDYWSTLKKVGHNFLLFLLFWKLEASLSLLIEESLRTFLFLCREELVVTYGGKGGMGRDGTGWVGIGRD